MNSIRTLFAAAIIAAALGAHAQAPVNINTAGAEALAEAIKGVGLKRAEAIVAYRDKHGPFATVDDLAKVQGIGERILEGSRGNLTAGKPE